MPKLPQISGKELIKILSLMGFEKVRQKGSHVVLKNDSGNGCVVPLHKELAVGTMRSVLRQANITIDDFLEYYN